MRTKYPIIFIPGIMGSHIVNSNSMYNESFFGLKENPFVNYDIWKLSEDPNYDESEYSIIKNTNINYEFFGDVYKGFFHYFQWEQETNFYIFTYDWRKSCIYNSKLLYKFMSYLINKLYIMKNKNRNEAKFNFVTHSMGGLILNSLFDIFDSKKNGRFLNNEDYTLSENDFNKIILCACPFKGSLNAIDMIVRGKTNTLIDIDNTQNEKLSHLSRTFPSVYELVATYDKAIYMKKGNAEANIDMTDGSNWQSNLFFDDIKNPTIQNPEKTKEANIINKRLIDMKEFKDNLYDLSKLPNNIKSKTVILCGRGNDTPYKLEKANSIVSIGNNMLSKQIENYLYFDKMTIDKNGDGTVHIDSSSIYKNDILTLSYNNIDHAGFFNNSEVKKTVFDYLCDRDVHDGKSLDTWWISTSGNIIML